MKKIMMVLSAALISVSVLGQHPGHHGKNRDRVAQADKLKSVLSLDEKQYAKAKEIDAKYAEKAKELRREDSAARMKRNDALKSLREEKSNEIDGLLTPEQKTKLAAHRAEQKQQHQEKRKEKLQKREEFLKKELSLSDDQQKAMRKSAEKFRGKAKELHQREGSPESKKADLRKMRDEHDAEMKSILSAEQYQKWVTLKHEQKKHPRNKKGGRGHHLQK